MILTLESSFSCAHFYKQNIWDENQNKNVFGKCFSPHGHGHNYKLQVGFQIDESAVSEKLILLQKIVTDSAIELDHKHLNFEIAEFKEKNPTTENIASFILKKMQYKHPHLSITFIRVFEMENLWAEIQL